MTIFSKYSYNKTNLKCTNNLTEDYVGIGRLESLELTRIQLKSILTILSVREPFDQQVVVTLVQKPGTTQSGNMLDISTICAVIAIRRNTKAGSYIQPNLSVNCHFITTVAKFLIIMERIYQERNIPKWNSSEIPITYVSDSTEYFCSRDRQIVVHNYVQNARSTNMKTIADHMRQACLNGFLDSMKFSTSKRQCSNDNAFEESRACDPVSCKNPYVHSGYTMSNPRKYKYTRQTQLGHTRPYLMRASIDSLSSQARISYAYAIASSIRLMSESTCCFVLPNKSSYDYRIVLRTKHQDMFRLNEHEHDDIKKWLLNEANSSYISIYLGNHTDPLDCRQQGMNGAVATTVLIPTNEQYVKSQEMIQWLRDNGCEEAFPLTTVSYSRRVCHDASIRPNMEHRFLERCHEPTKKLYQCLFKALHETSSETDFSHTWDSFGGISFPSVSQQINTFNNRQKNLFAQIKNGSYSEESLMSRFATIGKVILSEVKNVCDDLVQLNCSSNSKGNVIPDMNKTFQGPHISLSAAYDRSRYISSFVDGFGDIHFNFKQLKEWDRLALACFFSIQCNGSLPICELTRRLIVMKEYLLPMLHSHFAGSFWDLIVFVSRSTSFSCLGSSKQMRCTISTRGQEFEFAKYKRTIMNQLRKFSVLDNDEICYRKYKEVYSFLREKGNIKMCGPFAAQMLLHSSAMIGLVPFRIATMASVVDGGPYDVIKLCDPSGNVENTFERACSDIREIYGEGYTRAYAENTLCEIKRISQRRSMKLGLQETSLHTYLNLDNNMYSVGSTKTDCIAIYQHRGMEHCMQVLFRLKVTNQRRYQLEAKRFKIDWVSRVVVQDLVVEIDDWDDEDIDQYSELFEY